jgi:hypothetical protein
LFYRDNSTQYLEAEATIGSGPQTTLAVCGDPIICRALVLILRGPDYEVRYLPTDSLNVAGALTEVQILLLALERGTERRRMVLELLDSAKDADGVHILELTAGFESIAERRRQPARAERKISWPCSIEQLKQHINTALTRRLVVDETA